MSHTLRIVRSTSWARALSPRGDRLCEHEIGGKDLRQAALHANCAVETWLRGEGSASSNLHFLASWAQDAGVTSAAMAREVVSGVGGRLPTTSPLVKILGAWGVLTVAVDQLAAPSFSCWFGTTPIILLRSDVKKRDSEEAMAHQFGHLMYSDRPVHNETQVNAFEVSLLELSGRSMD
jgi:hypothetical protein